MQHLRYVKIGESTERLILHAFTGRDAILEVPETGALRLVDGNTISFDPPTQQFVREQEMIMMRAQAAQGGPSPARR